MRKKYDVLVKYTGKVHVSLRQRIRKSVVARVEEATGFTWEPRRETFSGGSIQEVETLQEIFAQEYPDWECTWRDERPRYRSRQDRVAWSDIRSEGYLGGGWRGFVKGRRLFRVYSIYTTKDGEVWHLHTSLPGFEVRKENGTGGWAMSGASREEMQDAAEEILREFVESIGAVFADGKE